MPTKSLTLIHGPVNLHFTSDCLIDLNESNQMNFGQSLTDLHETWSSGKKILIHCLGPCDQ